MTDYFRGKTLICEQTKPRTYFTPIFQRIGDRLKLHHMEVDCLSYQHSKKMLPIEHMGKHKRRIFELEDENAKQRELLRDTYDCICEMYKYMDGGYAYEDAEADPAYGPILKRMRELGVVGECMANAGSDDDG